ncbi:MAG: TolC family protein [Mariprofundales bacterium]|nr:TolC family protein [Mariprofundales bacterium]
MKRKICRQGAEVQRRAERHWVRAMLIAIFLFPHMTLAQDGVGLTAAVNRALTHAPSLQAAMAARDASQEDRVLGRAWLLPFVEIKGSAVRQKQDSTYFRHAGLLKPIVRSWNTLYGINAYQPLFDIQRWAAYKQGEVAAEQGKITLALANQQAMLQAVAAWLDVVRARAAFEAAKSSEQAMAKLAAQAKAAFIVGTVSINNSLAATSRHDLARAITIQDQQRLEQAQALLDSLEGRATPVVLSLSANMVPIAMPSNLKQWQQRAEEGAIPVHLSQQQLKLADAGSLKALGGALPKVQLVAGWSRTENTDGTFGGSRERNASIGVELSMPLYAGGATGAQQRKSDRQQVAAEFRLDDAKRNARLAARQSWLELHSTAAELIAANSALSSASLEVKAANEGLKVGLRTITEALDAEDRLAAARSRYADVVVRHGMAWLQLYAVVGALNSGRIQQLEAWLHCNYSAHSQFSR